MKDALGQELFEGDLIACTTSKKVRLGIVKKAILPGNDTSAMNITFPVINIINTYDHGLRQRVTRCEGKILYKTLYPSEIVKVSRDVLATCKPAYSPVYSTMQDALVAAQHQVHYQRMWAWLFQFYPLPKLKLPGELKNL